MTKQDFLLFIGNLTTNPTFTLVVGFVLGIFTDKLKKIMIPDFLSKEDYLVYYICGIEDNQGTQVYKGEELTLLTYIYNKGIKCKLIDSKGNKISFSKKYFHALDLINLELKNKGLFIVNK